MRKTTEVMSVKEFMNGDYHMDALGAVLGILFMLSLPAYYIYKMGIAGSVVAYKLLPLAILL